MGAGFAPAPIAAGFSLGGRPGRSWASRSRSRTWRRGSRVALLDGREHRI